LGGEYGRRFDACGCIVRALRRDVLGLRRTRLHLCLISEPTTNEDQRRKEHEGEHLRSRSLSRCWLRVGASDRRLLDAFDLRNHGRRRDRRRRSHRRERIARLWSGRQKRIARRRRSNRRSYRDWRRRSRLDRGRREGRHRSVLRRKPAFVHAAFRIRFDGRTRLARRSRCRLRVRARHRGLRPRRCRRHLRAGWPVRRVLVSIRHSPIVVESVQRRSTVCEDFF
jgi:hypothetical protein